jgi:hypothetical protein
MFPWLPASDQLDRTLALLGFFGSILLIIFVSLRIGRVVYTLVGVLSLFACITWLALRRRGYGAVRPSLSQSQSYILATTFFFLMLCGEVVLYTRPHLYERPLLFFLILILSAGLIAIQILMVENPPPVLVLLEIIVLGISIAWSQLLIFPDIVGVDPWYHEYFTMRILSGNTIPPGEVYSSLPIFHLLIGVTSLLGDLSYKLAVMLSVSLIQIIVDCTFVYLIGQHILSSRRTGLMASLVLIIANQHIFMSYWSIPNSFAAVFIVGSLYLLWRTRTGVLWEMRAVLLAIPMTTLILTHSVSSMCMALVLFVAWGVYTFCRVSYPETTTFVKNPVPLVIPLLFSMGMFGWWYFGTSLVKTLSTLISFGFSADFFDSTPRALLLELNVIPVWEQVFNNLGLFLFFALAFIGLLYLVSTMRDDRIALAVVGATPLMIGFISLLGGYAVLYERWWYFSQLLLAIPTGIGVMVICTRVVRRSLPFTTVSSLLLIAVLAFLMILSPQADVDNHSFSENTMMTYSLTESELASMRTVSMHDTSMIKTDEYFSSSQQNRGMNTRAFDDNLYSENMSGLDSDTVLIRDAILNRPFKIFSNLFRLDYNLRNRLEFLDFSRIYDDGSVQGYRREH